MADVYFQNFFFCSEGSEITTQQLSWWTFSLYHQVIFTAPPICKIVSHLLFTKIVKEIRKLIFIFRRNFLAVTIETHTSTAYLGISLFN